MRRSPFRSTLLCALVCAGSAAAQNGHLLTGYGPVNLSMGGASTGNAMDAMGALFWNPAAIGALRRPEIAFGSELFSNSLDTASTVAAGSFGPGMPPADLAGSTSSDSDVVPIPSFAIVGRWDENSPWTFGIGAFGVGGFGVDFPVDPNNPIFTPQPSQGGMGFGGVYSRFQLMQVSPTVAERVAERWYVGLSVNLAWATLAVDPFPAATPDDADGNGKATYPSAAHGDNALGAGFAVGVFYEAESDWSVGVMVKTPTWMEPYRFNSADEKGNPRDLQFSMDVPGMISAGFGYRGVDRWTFAADLRYIDYADTDGFEKQGFDATGAVRGFGWDSIWVFAVGAQYELNPKLALRAGYSFNTNPVPDDLTFFNLACPAIIQHHLNLGLSWLLSEQVEVNVAWHHGLENTIRGPWYTAANVPIPGTAVESSMSTDSLVLGVQVFF